ncbi:hypothetical protein TFLX_01990 [Thermoflexales bacterium]|nr:hypothetical protein TFLX_01990 [Thermoflexales bacterium]
MINPSRYEEKLSSNKTAALFLVLTLLCLALAIWRMSAVGLDILAAIFLVFFLFFLFYSLNYRTLIIQLTPEVLKLRFGIFTWTTATDNIANYFLDQVSLRRIGGAGIHFSSFQGRYRAMFNFLEYPRIVIMLKNKKGPVRDVAFSTRRPDEIMHFIQEATSIPNVA